MPRRAPERRIPALADLEPEQASSAIFVVMRRMRAPLITLIVTFTVSVVGLTLVPGVDDSGRPAHVSLFDAFYFVSYTATTIGFGELPWPFTPAQRLWVTVTIDLSVVGWAYAIGSLLTLLQDRAFQHAVALQRFTRKVGRLREPFFLVAGFGRAGELLAKDFDALGQQLVVVDSPPAVSERSGTLSATPGGGRVSRRSEGTFEVLGFTPAAVEPAVEVTTGMPVGLATMEKRFTGEVDGTSATWFVGGQAPDGSGTYVALESFAGTLDATEGCFVFAHAASTHGEDRYAEFFMIAPGSGTGGLAGIAGGGGMSIDDDGTHRIWFDWDLPSA